MLYKNYSRYLQTLFGISMTESEEMALNLNSELADIVNNQLIELWSPVSLEYISIDRYLLKNRSVEDFADYIRRNADTLADFYFSRALRQLRQPSQIKKLRPFVKND